MTSLRTDHVRSFLEVADAHHFGVAADRLGLGQSTVSGHVRALEDVVGTPLLVRTSRTVSLSPAGEGFVPAARALLRDLDRAVADARAVADGDLGTLRVAAQHGARSFILPGVVVALRASTPRLRLEVVPTTTAEGLAAAAGETVDVALVCDPPNVDGLAHENLVEDPIVAVLPRAHPLAGRRSLALGELRGECRVGWGGDGSPALNARLRTALVAAGLRSEAHVELRGVDTRIGTVATGIGYALESASYGELFGRRVSFVPLEGRPLTATIAAVWPVTARAPGLPAFLDATRASARTLHPRRAGRPDEAPDDVTRRA